MSKKAKNANSGLDRFDILILLAILVLSFVPRLILMLDTDAVLNGDECIQGLMAKHLLEGKDYSLYFYGQAYGFSFLENIFIAIAYKINGFGENSLKVAMFSLWFLGVSFFYFFLRSLVQKHFRWMVVILILILALSPAWISFSTQARAGYVSAFTLSCFSLFLWQKFKISSGLLILQAFVFVMIYESQPLWVPPLLPFLLYYLWPLKSWRKWFVFSFSSLVAFNLFGFYKSSLEDFWSPQIFSFTSEILTGNFNILFSKIYQNLSGLYFLEVDREIPIMISIFLFSYLAIVILSLAYGLFRIIRRKPNYKLDLAFLTSFLSIIVLSLFLKSFNSRYLIPLMGFSILPVLQFFIYQKKGIYLSLGLLLLGMVLTVAPNFQGAYFHPEERAHLEENLKAFDSLDYKYAFVKDPMMQWQLMYYSEEKIICRYLSKTDRHPPYTDAVNAAFRKKENYLLFGRSYRIKKPFSADVQTVDGGYSFILNPSAEKLKENGFKLPRD